MAELQTPKISRLGSASSCLLRKLSVQVAGLCTLSLLPGMQSSCLYRLSPCTATNDASCPPQISMCSVLQTNASSAAMLCDQNSIISLNTQLQLLNSASAGHHPGQIRHCTTGPMPACAPMPLTTRVSGTCTHVDASHCAGQRQLRGLHAPAQQLWPDRPGRGAPHAGQLWPQQSRRRCSIHTCALL